MDRTGALQRAVSLIAAIAAIFLTIFHHLAADSDVIIHPVAAHNITTNISEVELPYGFDFLAGSLEFGNRFRRNMVYDFNADGQDEEISAFTEDVGFGLSSKIILYYSALRSDALYQTYGPHSSYLIHQAQLIDVVGDAKPEVVLLMMAGDSLFLDIFSVNETSITFQASIPAAVGNHERVAKGWAAIHITADAGVDVNNDGYRDIILSRSAKPDSAFQRAIIAWDMFNNKEIWKFELADFAGPADFQIFGDKDSPIFTFTTCACANAYSTNGMDSRRAYVLSIDATGKELWRHTTGAEFFYSNAIAHDVNGDGKKEFLSIWDGNLIGDSAHSELRCLDPFTGRIVCTKSLDCFARLGTLLLIPGDSTHDAQIVVYAPDDRGSKIFFFGSNLNLTDTITGDITKVYFAYNFVRDSALELIVSDKYGKLAMLDRDLNVLAITELIGAPIPYNGTQGAGLFCDHGIKGWTVLMPFKRSITALLFARYKWWLAILFGSILALALLRGGQTMWRWREAALGLPTLNHIGAMVLLLDRKGRILFANNHSITNNLIGRKWKRRQFILDTEVRNQKELAGLLKNALLDPLSFEQQRIEIGAGDPPLKLQVTIYPYLNNNNISKGKVVIAENLGGHENWQWRTVLGEATQRWTHRLKHHLGSARLILGNVAEDPIVAERIRGNSEFKDQWFSIDRQIVEANASVTKVLRYLRNPKPNFAQCDINEIIQSIVANYRHRNFVGVDVSFSPTEELPSIMADQDQLGEVFDNLLSNAMQAISEKGSVIIKTRMADHLLTDNSGGAVEITIEDTGQGIPETDLPHIWEAGFSRFSGGTGVGLALIKEIITNHGGEITVTSRPGQGSQFVVCLPISRR